MLARLKDKHRHLIEPIMRFSKSLRNIPYDELYLSHNYALYCSELVVAMFRHANGGTPFFKEAPMSFRDLATGRPHQTWIDYYAYFGIDVPEGEPGSNPDAISRDDRLNVYKTIGQIPGLR